MTLFEKKMSKIFISHASEDKKLVAGPLADLLRARGHAVWYDDYSLRLGDSLRRSIDSGLASCDYGVVILSSSFFSKEWPQKELDALSTREVSEARKLVLPVWHEISASEIALHSPMLADKIGVPTTNGLHKVIESITGAIQHQISEDEIHGDYPVLYNFKDQNVLDWRKTVAGIFGNSGPKSTSWSSLDEILNVLRKIAQPNFTHCFLPTRGGMDLEAAKRYYEQNCLELRWSKMSAAILKPIELRLEIFPGVPSLSYFHLQADNLKPWSDGINLTNRLSEVLAELAPGHYADRRVLDSGYLSHNECGAGEPLPMGTRKVTRFLSGSFVFFAKGSAYNQLDGKLHGYLAQHNSMPADAFRGFIADLIHKFVLREIELEPDRRPKKDTDRIAP